MACLVVHRKGVLVGDGRGILVGRCAMVGRLHEGERYAGKDDDDAQRGDLIRCRRNLSPTAHAFISE